TDLMLPWVGVPLFDPANQTLVWPRSGEGTWDATVAILYWGSADRSGTWRIIGPPGQDSFVIPPLPEDFEDWLSSDPAYQQSVLMLIEMDAVNGWSAARQPGTDLETMPGRTGDGSSTIRRSLVIPLK